MLARGRRDAEEAVGRAGNGSPYFTFFPAHPCSLRSGRGESKGEERCAPRLEPGGATCPVSTFQQQEDFSQNQ